MLASGKVYKQPIKIFLAIFILSQVLFLAHFLIVKSVVWGDGRYYFSYVRSFVSDGDLDFSNESKIFNIAFPQTKDGKFFNVYSIGPAILWLPFFSAGFLFSNLVHADTLLVPALFTGTGAVFYGVAGLYFSYLSAKLLNLRWGLQATLTLFFATNAFFYIALDPVNSHTSSFFISSLLVYCTVKLLKNSAAFWVLYIGFLSGFLTMIRTQDIIFLLPLSLIVLTLAVPVLKKVYFLLLLGSSFLIAFTPQLSVWQVMIGKIQSPYLEIGKKFNWFEPKIFETLFSLNNGLFTYSPVLVLSLVGLVLYSYKQKIAWIGSVLFVLETYVIASWEEWHGGTAFGARMFLSLTPFFILGLGFFFEKYFKHSAKSILVIALIFTIINVLQILIFLKDN